KVDIDSFFTVCAAIPDLTPFGDDRKLIQTFHQLHVMRRTGVEDIRVPIPVDAAYILHLKADPAGSAMDPGKMNAIYCQKVSLLTDDSHVVGESDDASAAVAAHGPFKAVGVEIYHLKIMPLGMLKKHQAISPDTEPPVT